MCTQAPMRPGSSISVWNSLISDFPPTSCPLKKAYFNALYILCLTSSLILSHTCTPGCVSFSSIIWQKRWIFSYICELNENKAPLLSVLCSWSFAKNNVGFISCVGLKMLSWCQTTYQDAGLHVFNFPAICLVLSGQPKTHENNIQQWNRNGVLETAVAAA